VRIDGAFLCRYADDKQIYVSAHGGDQTSAMVLWYYTDPGLDAE